MFKIIGFRKLKGMTLIELQFASSIQFLIIAMSILLFSRMFFISQRLLELSEERKLEKQVFRLNRALFSGSVKKLDRGWNIENQNEKIVVRIQNEHLISKFTKKGEKVYQQKTALKGKRLLLQVIGNLTKFVTQKKARK
ncbi:hypothetical protein ACFL35_18855 [Candidatus Riflebacteria bacterium]